MPTKTSVGSGLWSAIGTWDAGVPVDNDTVVIAAGHVVEFDVVQSGFANGIAGMTINGTLNLTLTAGTYYLKIKNATLILGAGTFNCGTLANPIPYGTNHTIQTGTGQSYISGTNGLTCNVYGTEPAIQYVTTTSQIVGGNGVTVNIDRDISGDIWAVGNLIGIFQTVAADIEYRTIVSKTASSITFNSVMAYSKPIGSRIFLVSRNIVLSKAANPDVSVFGNFQRGKLKLVSCYSPTPAAYGSGGGYFGDGIVIDGGVYIGSGQFTSGNDTVVNGGWFISTYNSLEYYGTFGATRNLIINGGYFVGAFVVAPTCFGIDVSGGVFIGNSNVFSNSRDVKIHGGTFLGNIYDLNKCSGMADGMTLGFVTAENVNYNLPTIAADFTFASENYKGVLGALKYWSKGGISTSQASVVPSGYTQAYLMKVESALYPCIMKKAFSVPAGQTVLIDVQLRKDSSMTYLPRAYLMEAIHSPFTSAVPVESFIMSNSVDTWENKLFSVANPTTFTHDYVLWFLAANATGNVYSAYKMSIVSIDLAGVLANQVLIRAKTDQFVFTVPNQVNANALTGGGGLTQADIRTAIGLAIANLDTQLANMQADLDNPAQYKADVSGLALVHEYDADVTQIIELLYSVLGGEGWTTESLVSIQAAIGALPAGISTADIMNTVVEGTYTLQDVLKIMSGALAGKLTGGGTGTLTFRDLSDTLDRIIATVDLANGDRDTITVDVN